MHIVISILIGLLGAWIFKHRNGADHLGFKWRMIGGAAAGVFPHLEALLYLFGTGTRLQIAQGLTWSLLLAPFWAWVISLVLLRFNPKKRMNQFFPFIWGSLTLVCLFGALTETGIQPLFPLINWRLNIGLLSNFDYILLALCVMTLILGLLFRQWQRDTARIGLVFIFVYLIAVSSFYFKANNFANRYAKALKLTVERIDILPQPLSPLNWRLMVTEKNGRIHDTFIHLYRENELKVPEGATRAYRISALYKPLHKAVWRIYRRYGSRHLPPEDSQKIYHAWQAFKSSPYYWYGRFGIFVKFTDPAKNSCALFRDLRYEGARKSDKGHYLVCAAEQTYKIFRRKKDSFVLLKTLYTH